MAAIELHRQRRLHELEANCEGLVLLKEQMSLLEQEHRATTAERDALLASLEAARCETEKYRDLVTELQRRRAPSITFAGDKRGASERIIELVRCCPAGNDKESLLYSQIEAMLSQLSSTGGNASAGGQGPVRDALLSEDLRQENHTLKETIVALRQQREASQHVLRELRARCAGREQQNRELSTLLAAAELAKDTLLLEQCSLTSWATPTADRYALRAHSIVLAESEREAARERERDASFQVDTLKMKLASLEKAAAQHERDRALLQATADRQAGEIKRLQALLDEALENLEGERLRKSSAQSYAQNAELELKVLRSLHVSGK